MPLSFNLEVHYVNLFRSPNEYLEAGYEIMKNIIW